MLKYWRKIRHGQIYRRGVYNHGKYIGLYDHVTTKHSLGKLLYFIENEEHQLAF